MRNLVTSQTKLSQTKEWTYLFLWLSMGAFGAAAFVFVVTINAEDWRWTSDFPLAIFALLGASLLFAILGGAGRKNEHKPRVSLSALGGLVSVVVGALGFSSSTVTADVATWIGIIGLTVTMVLLPLGWNGDAQVAEQAKEISALRSQLQDQASELERSRHVATALQKQLGHLDVYQRRATVSGLALAFAVSTVGIMAALVETALKRGHR
jgi:hypothetical protein